jgi:hypothetical protein
MNKKEIYEHLANIYLDASSKSSKKKSKLRSLSKSIQSFAIVGLVMALGIGSALTYSHVKQPKPIKQIALFLHQDTVKINFNFDPAKKETFTLNLKQLNLSGYKALSFSARKTNPKDIIALRIEFVNRFNEKSEVYVKNISSKWSEEKIDFKQFAKLYNWTQMKEIVFSVEEWNAREKTGVVYLENIKVIK